MHKTGAEILRPPSLPPPWKLELMASTLPTHHTDIKTNESGCLTMCVSSKGDSLLMVGVIDQNDNQDLADRIACDTAVSAWQPRRLASQPRHDHALLLRVFLLPGLCDTSPCSLDVD